MNRTHKIISFLILFSAGSALFVVFVVYPIFRGVLDDHEEALAQKKELVQLQEDRKRLQEFQSTFQAYRADFTQLENLFVDTETPIEFFRFLDDAAEEFGLVLKKNPGVPRLEKDDVWPSMSIELQGDGPYPGAVAFLQKVENAPYLIEAKDFSIAGSLLRNRRSISLQEEGVVRFLLVLKVYTEEI